MLLKKNRPFDFWVVAHFYDDGRVRFLCNPHSFDYCKSFASHERYCKAKYGIPGKIKIVGCHNGDLLECLICGSYSFINQIGKDDTCPRCETSLAPFAEVGL